MYACLHSHGFFLFCFFLRNLLVLESMAIDPIQPVSCQNVFENNEKCCHINQSPLFVKPCQSY